MFSQNFRKILKYSLVGTASLGALYSLKANQYNLESVGIIRLTRACCTVADISLTYKRQLLSLNLDKDSKEYIERKSQCHTHAAEKLLKLCCTNKGIYIKVGQHIAALDYLLPSEYVQTMRVLHSEAPSNDINDIYKVIKEELKQDVSELFLEFDETPLGTASLAQVHKAKLKDGSIVAIKVQHPYVQGNSKVDLKTMETLVKIVSMVFPDFQFQWLVEETKKNMPKELNFAEEGRNAEKISSLIKYFDWLYIPKIRWEYTTSRVLTMEYVEGGKVNDLQYIQDHKINPFEVSDKLGLLYSHMIFYHGFVHSDPHPGNILLIKSDDGTCRIILLDHGLYAELSKEFKYNYANLWLSILDSDRPSMRMFSKNLGIEGDLYGAFACMVSGRTWDTIMDGILKKKPSSSEKEVMKRELPNLLPTISKVLEKVNRQMILIFKTNDLIRGIESALKTSYRMSAFKVMTKCCVNSIYEEKIINETSRFQRFQLSFQQFWRLFKVNIFYTFIMLKHLSYRFM